MDIIELVQNHGDNVVWFLLGNASLWLLSKLIPSWVKFSYDKRLEVFKREILQRDKASMVAELVPLLRVSNPDEEQILRINTIFAELSLYLPKEIVCNMAHTSVGTKESENIGWSDLFGDIRDYLNGNYKYSDKKRRNTNLKDRVVGDNIVYVASSRDEASGNSGMS